MKKIIWSFLFIVLVSSFVAFAGDWKVNNDKTQMSFKIKGPFGNVNGTVKNLTGSINFDETHLASSKIDVTADATTIKTGNGMRDGHLKKEEWFNVAKFPTIHFVSQSFSKTSYGFVVTGTLTMKEVSKPLTFPFTFEQKNKSGTFKGSFVINRLDFGVGEKSFTTGNDVTVNLEVQTEMNEK